jgi:DNA segregation ATPase FtsK/SpoIIIE, S-DNA-T family
MRNVTGEQLAQVDNPDPFASPVWRSPVYRTPEFVIWLVQLARLVWRVIWFALRHPLVDAVAGLVMLIWLRASWPGVVVLAAVVLAGLVLLRAWRPVWFARLVSGPARCRWRWWFYRRHWQAVMTITRLAPSYRGRVIVPVLGQVTVTGCTDRVTVALVSGQSPPTSPRGPRGSRTASARTCAASAPLRPARSCWSWSAAMRWPTRCPRSGSPR